MTCRQSKNVFGWDEGIERERTFLKHKEGLVVLYFNLNEKLRESTNCSLFYDSMSLRGRLVEE